MFLEDQELLYMLYLDHVVTFPDQFYKVDPIISQNHKHSESK